MNSTNHPIRSRAELVDQVVENFVSGDLKALRRPAKHERFRVCVHDEVSFALGAPEAGGGFDASAPLRADVELAMRTFDPRGEI